MKNCNFVCCQGTDDCKGASCTNVENCSLSYKKCDNDKQKVSAHYVKKSGEDIIQIIDKKTGKKITQITKEESLH